MSSLFTNVATVQRSLDYHLERHNVIASNVANVDTPGFRPLDLARVPESRAESRVRVTATHEAHIGKAPASPAGELVRVDDPYVRPGNDGNAVSLEREMSKLAANDLRYDGAAKIVARQIGLLRYAANGGQGG